MAEEALMIKLGEAVAPVFAVLLLLLFARWLFRRARAPKRDAAVFTHAPAPPQGADSERQSGRMKCPQCGLVNFATAEWCKRCGLSFTEEEPPESAEWEPMSAGAPSYAHAFGQASDEAPKDGRLAKFSANSPLFAVLLMLAGKYVHFALPVLGLLLLVVGLCAGAWALVRMRGNGGRAARRGVVFNAAALLVFGVIPLAYLWNLRGVRAATKEPVWREYKSAAEGYAVKMPGETVVKEKTVDVPNMGPVTGRMTLVELGPNDLCMVGHFDYGRYWGDLTSADFEKHAQDLLDKSAEGVVAASKFTPLSRKSITLDDYQGLELEGIPPDEVRGSRPLYHTIRIYLVPPRVYIVSIIGPITGVLYKEKAKFLDSFRLLPADEMRRVGASMPTRDAEAYHEAREWLDAASRGYADTVQKLIDAGADVDQVVGGETALTRAALRGHTKVVKVLIDADADLDIRGEQYGATALWLATIECRNADIVRLLVGAGADVSLKTLQGDTPLQSATRRGCRESVDALSAAGED